MIKTICKIFRINRIGEWHQYKNNKGEYINTHGYIYFIKGVCFNSAKFKSVYNCDKKYAIKYIIDTIKNVYYNIKTIRKINKQNIVLN